MQAARSFSGNSRTEPTPKRAVMRALRHFFLWGWVRYHGQLAQEETHLTALFPKETIAYARALLRGKQKWWFESDPSLQYRHNNNTVHLPQNARALTAERRCSEWSLLTYNCQSLGVTSARLTEIAEDLHARKIHVAAIQGTCWKHDHGRSEWIVRSRKGQPLYDCLSWGKSSAQAHNGVMLLPRFSVFESKHFTQRLDPSKHNARRGSSGEPKELWAFRPHVHHCLRPP